MSKHLAWLNIIVIDKSSDALDKGKRVYGQFNIETIHERRKRNREFSGVFFFKCCSAMALRSVLLIRIGKQNV